MVFPICSGLVPISSSFWNGCKRTGFRSEASFERILTERMTSLRQVVYFQCSLVIVASESVSNPLAVDLDICQCLPSLPLFVSISHKRAMVRVKECLSSGVSCLSSDLAGPCQCA